MMLKTRWYESSSHDGSWLASPDFHGSFGHGNVLTLRNRRVTRFLHERCDHRGGLELFLELAGFIEELLAPLAVLVQDLMKLGCGGNMHDAFVEHARGTEAFGIPRRDFAEHAAGEIFAKDLYHEVQVPAHDAHPLVKRGFRQKLADVHVSEGRVTRVPSVHRFIKIWGLV